LIRRGGGVQVDVFKRTVLKSRCVQILVPISDCPSAGVRWISICASDPETRRSVSGGTVFLFDLCLQSDAEMRDRDGCVHVIGHFDKECCLRM
jgi:hypothetical protein